MLYHCHTESLRKNIIEGYLSGFDGDIHKLFLNNYEKFLKAISLSNIKSSLKNMNEESQDIIYRSFKLNPGDIYPNMEELDSMAGFIKLYIKNKEVPKISQEIKKEFKIYHMNLDHILKQVIIKTYLDIDGKFPSPNDFKERLSRVSAELAKDLDDNLFIYTVNNPEQLDLDFYDTLKEFLEKIHNLKMSGYLNIYSSSMIKFNRFSILSDYINQLSIDYDVKTEIGSSRSLDRILIQDKNSFFKKEKEKEEEGLVLIKLIDKICDETKASEMFKFILKEPRCSTKNTLCLSLKSRQMKLLMSNNFSLEFNKFCSYVKDNKLGQIYLANDNLREKALHISFGLEHPVTEFSQKDLLNLLSN